MALRFLQPMVAVLVSRQTRGTSGETGEGERWSLGFAGEGAGAFPGACHGFGEGGDEEAAEGGGFVAAEAVVGDAADGGARGAVEAGADVQEEQGGAVAAGGASAVEPGVEDIADELAQDAGFGRATGGDLSFAVEAVQGEEGVAGGVVEAERAGAGAALQVRGVFADGPVSASGQDAGFSVAEELVVLAGSEAVADAAGAAVDVAVSGVSEVPRTTAGDAEVGGATGVAEFDRNGSGVLAGERPDGDLGASTFLGRPAAHVLGAGFAEAGGDTFTGAGASAFGAETGGDSGLGEGGGHAAPPGKWISFRL